MKDELNYNVIGYVDINPNCTLELRVPVKPKYNAVRNFELVLPLKNRNWLKINSFKFNKRKPTTVNKIRYFIIDKYEGLKCYLDDKIAKYVIPQV